MLFALATYSRQASFYGNTTEVFYELPKLVSGASLALKCASSYANYFVAFTSDQQLDNLKITLNMAYNGASVCGGLIFAVKSVTIRLSTINFLQSTSLPEMAVVLLNDYLNIYNSSLKIQNNKFIYTKALVTIIAANNAQPPLILQRDQPSQDLVGALPCSKCSQNESTVEDSCWGCSNDAIIDNVALKTCKCRYSNALLNQADNTCYTTSTISSAIQYDDSGVQRAYLLDCGSNKQINISVSVSWPTYQSFSVLKNDNCNPANLYIVGRASFSGFDTSVFRFGGLTYKLQQGATQIRVNLNVSTSSRFQNGGLLYATASDLTNSVTIDETAVSGSLTCTSSGSAQMLPFGGFIGHASNCKNLAIKNSRVYGLLYDIRYWQAVGIIVGRALLSVIGINNLYISPLQNVHSNYTVDPALADWDQVTFKCKSSASEALKPSFYLQALALEYNLKAKSQNTRVVGSSLLYVGGLLGYGSSSQMTAKNVIAQLDIVTQNSGCYYGGSIAGGLFQTNITLSDTYSSAYVLMYRFMGGIGYMSGGTSNLVMAINVSAQGEWNGGAIAAIAGSATVEIRIAQNTSFTGDLWINGVVAQLNESSVLTVYEAIGAIVYPDYVPNYSSILCGNVYDATLNGRKYTLNTTGVNDSSISKINSCQ